MKRSTLAAILIAFPIPGLAITLGLYAIGGFVFRNSEIAPIVGLVLSVVLGLMGIICVLGLLIATPIGLYLLVTDRNPEVEPLDRK